MNQKNLIKQDISIKDALKKMKKFGTKNLFITNLTNQLVGSVSSGDIRDAILKKTNLSNQIYNFANLKPKFLLQKNNRFNKKKADLIFQKHNVDLIPIVDNNKIIKDILSWSDFYNKTPTKENKKKKIF